MTTAPTLEFLRSPTDTPPPVRRLPSLGYFERALPIRVILGSFLFLTLPIAALVLLLPNEPVFTWLYIWLFGGTHIVLTLTIYGSRSNRRYFTNGPRNAAVFVAIPLTLLACYLAIYWLQIGTMVPWLAILFWGGLRFFNFFHLNRQTFGVHQLFKARTKAKFPAWAKRCENGTGLALVATLMLTHVAGGVCPLLLPDSPTLLKGAWMACAGLAGVLYLASIVALFRARPAPDSPGFREVMLYFTLQNLGIAAATIYLPLYLASLAMHYVEYHVLMVPRIAKQELDPTSRIDRGYGWLRARPIAFLLALLGLSALVTTGMGSMDFTPGDGRWGTLLVAFDALVAIHYFLEMQIWKFSDPHIRKSLDGIYFAKRPHTS